MLWSLIIEASFVEGYIFKRVLALQCTVFICNAKYTVINIENPPFAILIFEILHFIKIE